MHGSQRSSSRICKARHSARSRAPTPVGSKLWTTASTASTIASGTPRAHVPRRLGQIARLVDVCDQVRRDRQLRPGERVACLRQQMVVQAGAGTLQPIEVERLATPGRHARLQARSRRRVAVLPRPRLRRGGQIERRVVRGRHRLHAVLARTILQQRIAGDRVGHHDVELLIGERQQVDGVLQLRRHHRRLAGAKLKAGRERHRHLLGTRPGRSQAPGAGWWGATGNDTGAAPLIPDRPHDRGPLDRDER